MCVYAPLRNGTPRWFRQKSEAILIADMDGLRSSLCLKGSAGIKPCLQCLNVVKKDSGLDPAEYPSISEASMNKFQLATNRDIWDLADALRRLVEDGATKSTVSKFEKASGLVYFSDGLFFADQIRKCLPPSGVCVDAMHAYFSNGVASWEIALCFSAVQKYTSWTWEKMKDAALTSRWTGPKCSKHCLSSYVKSLFSEKCFTETVYKGQATQTESLVPLLVYYLVEGCSSVENLQPYLSSFLDLAACCAELRKLRYQWNKVSPADMVPLQRAQEIHQRSFVTCYSVDLVKPKHHHRMHVPQAFIKMSLALQCETHESKHRNYKHGLAERMKSTSQDGFQKSMLPRLLSNQANRVQEQPLEPLKLVPPFQDAAQVLKDLARDQGLKTVKALRYYQSTVHPDDILYLADGTAGLVQTILAGHENYFWLHRLQLVRTHRWGKVWKTSSQYHLMPILAQTWTQPPWWRWDQDQVACLL